MRKLIDTTGRTIRYSLASWDRTVRLGLLAAIAAAAAIAGYLLTHF